MTSRIAPIVALLLMLSTPLGAQSVGQVVSSDLDGDGRAERFELIDSGDGTADLRIDDLSGRITFAPGIAWLGGIGQQPDLDLAPNGSVQLMSMNEAIGRNRWRLTLTIAFRQGQYMVAGYTYDWYDTLDPEANGTCDLNLLTGKGFLSKNGGADVAIRTSLKAKPVTEWKDDVDPYSACGLG